MSRLLAVGLVLLVSACASRHLAQGHNNSPEYAAGYGDGCQTASARATHEAGGDTRDQTLYQTSRDYRSGWTAGYASCGTSNSGSTLSNPLGSPFGK